MRFIVVFIFLLISRFSFSIEIEKAAIKTLSITDIHLISSQVDLPINDKNYPYLLGEEDFGIPLPLYPNTGKAVKRKVIAVTLAVTLGVFGVHRLYLGTSTKVPIIYTLTLGGGFGVLVVSDIIAILATKSLDAFSPNEKVFMWAE